MKLILGDGIWGHSAYGFYRADNGETFELENLVETDLDLLRSYLESMLAAVYADDEKNERKACFNHRFEAAGEQ